MMQQLSDFCTSRRIPYFVAVATGDDGTHTEYMKDGKSGLSLGVALTDEHIVNYIKLSVGCEVVFPESIPDIEI